ncbi:MAG: hypothetical protein P1U77_27630 [Rubripirellula sp.]|nr:hypothetical protein [Rubripirellula sp.]
MSFRLEILTRRSPLRHFIHERDFGYFHTGNRIVGHCSLRRQHDLTAGISGYRDRPGNYHLGA